VSFKYVTKVWQRHGLKAHRQGTFKVSRDPAFAAKVADVVGLYLDPPGGAVVLSGDEKTQIQALDRTQPLLPLDFGITEKRTHDYRRHGTTNLFAALNTGTGHVTADCYQQRAGRAAPPLLSARELEVLSLVARGRTNADIRREPHIAEATVKNHLLRAFTKLEVADRTAAVTTAMSLGLLT
jgi:DNA-binding CsgD family transcriptional regulator